MNHHLLLTFLVFLLCSVVGVSLFRALKLPPMLGYLVIGILIGPHALGWLPSSEQTRYLAEFGVVFLMFSIGLEFSLPKLKAMRNLVFGLGGLQVLITTIIFIILGNVFDLSWEASLVIGGILSMSSTAIVTKMLSEKASLHTSHGKNVIGVLIFQDLAVVPFLILLPALAQSGGQSSLGMLLASGLFKATVILLLIAVVGNKIMRPWFMMIAKRNSSELFMMNVLLITLGLGYFTELFGLSMALGAFLGGMLIAETEYRYQVEDVVKPFRDILLGMFFVGLGMMLDIEKVIPHFDTFLAILLFLIIGKTLVIFGLAKLFKAENAVSLRTGIILAQGGEFGFVLLSQAREFHLLEPHIAQPILASMLVSMLIAPFLIEYNKTITGKFFKNEWLNRAKELHDIAMQSMEQEKHVLICGYGRSGQNVARLLEQENFNYLAIDIDPKRVKHAIAGGDHVVYGDATRREVLIAAGLKRASAVVVSFADTHYIYHILSHIQQLKPEIPVIVRTIDDIELDKLRSAGASEIVPEVLEGSVMLATHTMLMLGVPPRHVIRRMRHIREEQYQFLKGFFRGVTDEKEDSMSLPRLQLVYLTDQAYAVDKKLSELKLDQIHIEVKAIRRKNIKGLHPSPETVLRKNDVLILLGVPEHLVQAEEILLQGKIASL